MGCLVRLSLDADAAGLIVNVGPDEGFISIGELAERVAAAVGFVGLAPIHLRARPREVQLATCSADLARARLGYRSERTLDEALHDIVAYVRERGPRPFVYARTLELVSEQTPRTWIEHLM